MVDLTRPPKPPPAPLSENEKPFKLYKRNGLWIALEKGEFVVLGEWLSEERVVFRPMNHRGPWDEEDCVKFAQGNGID